MVKHFNRPIFEFHKILRQISIPKSSHTPAMGISSLLLWPGRSRRAAFWPEWIVW